MTEPVELENDLLRVVVLPARRQPPFDGGTYTFAVEPWTSPPCLARAATRGAEARLEPGDALDVTVEVTISSPAGTPLRGVRPGGKINVQNPKEG